MMSFFSATRAAAAALPFRTLPALEIFSNQSFGEPQGGYQYKSLSILAHAAGSLVKICLQYVHT